ncbi:sensor histidine kinase [Fulvivirga maritima]|uniref:tetratricopeptide repeat-containing sensor histidine kinase n=1 Tax=Fulvivirga maritima TaxID=2904247 RepID=UPI001F15E118|nr:ATP-binding protein [Fulvivirga maritima]UII27050.1 sensor histidine kinase [Fulvivirga maritima]
MPAIRFFFILLLFFTFQANSQDQEQDQYSHFKAFGRLPNEVDYSLYQALHQARLPMEKLAYMDTIGIIFMRTDLVDSVIHYGREMHQIISTLSPEEANVIYYEQRAYFYEGVGKREIGLLDDAIATFIKGIELPVEEDNTMQKFLQLGLARTYLAKREHTKANEIIQKLSTNRDELSLTLSIMLTKADYYFSKSNLDSAIVTYNQVLHEEKIDNYPKLKLHAQVHLGIIQSINGAKEEALSVFLKVKDQALENGFYDLYIKSILHEGKIYSEQKDYTIAEAALSMAYINSVSWNRLMLQRRVIRALVDLYVTKEDYKNAFSLMTQDASITRMISNKQNQLQLRDIELKYETLQKERKIDNLQKEQIKKEAEISRQKTIKNAILIGFFVILAPIILLLVVYYQKLQAQSLLNKQQEELNKQEVQSLLQSQELQLAKTSIAAQNEERSRIARELHDSIGGNLAGIKLQMNNITHQDAYIKQLMQQLDTTYEQVREISHSLIPKVFKDQAFTQLVSAYITNLSNTQETQLHFNVYPESEIDQLDQKLQVMLFNLIKELVTNAFKHAKATVINLQLSLLVDEGTIELLYEDNGVGFDINKTGKGIGLKNMEHRVETFSGTMAIDSAENRGTVISISIPKA